MKTLALQRWLGPSSSPRRRHFGYLVGFLVLVAMVALTAATVVGFSGSGTSGTSALEQLHATEARICKVLSETLSAGNGMDHPSLSKGAYAANGGNIISCTAADGQYDIVTLDVFEGTNGAANYKANVAADELPLGSLNGNDCIVSFRGPIDNRRNNTIPLTTEAFYCALALGANMVSDRVDALTKFGLSVTVYQSAAPADHHSMASPAIAAGVVRLLSM